MEDDNEKETLHFSRDSVTKKQEATQKEENDRAKVDDKADVRQPTLPTKTDNDEEIEDVTNTPAIRRFFPRVKHLLTPEWSYVSYYFFSFTFFI